MKVFTVSKMLWFMRPKGVDVGGQKRGAKEAPGAGQNAADLPAAAAPTPEQVSRGSTPAIENCPQRRNDEMFLEGPWAGLTGEALAEVFDRLPFEDRLRAVPLVCKDWRIAALSPTAWRNVDMGPWMEAKADEYCDWESEADMKTAVHVVVDRSGGQLTRLRTGYCTNEIVDYIAAKCPLLEDLSIHHSFTVDDESATNLARSCRRLERLDLSECYNVSAASIQAFGLNCPSLVSFTRNMTDILLYDDVVPPRGDEEAAAIAAHMVSLEVLHMRRMSSLTDSGLLLLARSCEQLERLDLACCDSPISAGLGQGVVSLLEAEKFCQAYQSSNARRPKVHARLIHSKLLVDASTVRKCKIQPSQQEYWKKIRLSHRFKSGKCLL